MSGPAIERFEDGGAAADAAAAAIAAAIAAGVRARGVASLVLTGGRTPAPIYDRLAAMPLAWERVWITLSDERRVEETSPASNARLLRERLLVGPAAAARFVSLPHGGGARLAAPRPFDLVLLGMGEDGHVASLFPGSPVLAEGLSSAAPTIAVPAGADRPPTEERVSLALRTLLDARRIVIFATGEAKLAVLTAPGGSPVDAVLHGPAPVRVIWSP
ncbi:MAG TPA: 6-phosphogluconolactonase [Caulobacteraceae bacterium]|jgi:6-phosphogluconolactonase|nr:6-phosphogluconolactonase [Caulobacteraceae bacterium]